MFTQRLAQNVHCNIIHNSQTLCQLKETRCTKEYILYSIDMKSIETEIRLVPDAEGSREIYCKRA